jgi:hypothetical protein
MNFVTSFTKRFTHHEPLRTPRTPALPWKSGPSGPRFDSRKVTGFSPCDEVKLMLSAYQMASNVNRSRHYFWLLARITVFAAPMFSYLS